MPLMTCPCHLVQISLIDSLASTLIGPQAQLSSARVRDWKHSACRAHYNAHQHAESATGSRTYPGAWKTSPSPSPACVSPGCCTVPRGKKATPRVSSALRSDWV